ncbi:MAG: peptidoglycan DD-metalloendopeptidase family protein [Coriobacteriia bacterium]|jgi:murein DD-endopeptidase MepM/ murein hydrolase activator NlpD|nr:peptidoglycan DD-metalloendopeptidase family protein [Coriobacteriia bacterium]
MTGTTHLTRWLALLVTVLVTAALLVPASVSAATSRTQQLQSELNKINDEFRRAGAAYDKAFWALDETEADIEKTNARITENEAALLVAQDQLQGRMASWYRTDDFGYMGFVLGAEDFTEFVTRMDYASRIASNDASAVKRVNGLLAELREDRDRLEVEQAERAKKVNRFKSERDALQKKLSAKKAEYERVQRELAEAARREEAARQKAAGRNSTTTSAVSRPISRAAVTAAPGPNGMVFPVAGPSYYSDTWAASRDGGRRRHKGTDIMASTGTPVVATLSGTVTRGNGSKSGLYLKVTADNGWQFYYMHLSSISVGSGRVNAGQVIGAVGYTGNASASAPHLHFEVHPSGRGAVNPYPYLRQMQGR